MYRPTLRVSQWRQSFTGKRLFSVSSCRLRIDNISPSAEEAIRSVRSGSTILVGGFGLSGVPATLINGLRDRKDLGNFTIVSNNAGMPGVGLGKQYLGLNFSHSLKNPGGSSDDRPAPGNGSNRQNDCFIRRGKQTV